MQNMQHSGERRCLVIMLDRNYYVIAFSSFAHDNNLLLFMFALMLASIRFNLR